MRKKISILLLALVCMLSFVGCGSTESTDQDITTMSSYSSSLITIFATMDGDTITAYLEGDEFELNMIMYESGIPADAETFVSILDAWETALEDCGSFVAFTSDFEAEVNGEEVTLTAEADFSDNDATITFIFNGDRFESLTIDPVYTFSEIIAKAILNTILGMGTVFVILIFISFIISLFKYIPVIEAKFKKKSSAEVAPTPVVVTPAVEVDVNADLDLIAVITAAIAASEGTSTDGFVVRSIKRRKSNKWNG